MSTVVVLEARAADSPFRHLTRDGTITLCSKAVDESGHDGSQRRCSVCWAHNGGRWPKPPGTSESDAVPDTCDPVVQFTVVGLAETQGSKTARYANGRAWVVDGSAKKAARHKGWREAVADAARDARDGAPLIRGVPVTVALAFWLPTPASAPKRRRTWPIGARSGDVDKLARSVLDSLTNTVIADDSQVVNLHVTKDYGDPPRVEVTLTPGDEP